MTSAETRDKLAEELDARVASNGLRACFRAGWDSCRRQDPDVKALYSLVSEYREYFNAIKEGEYENNRRTSPLRDYETKLQLEADSALIKFKEGK